MAEAQCRYCFDTGPGPGGLADILIEPCACTGTLSFSHVSCLYRWQLARQERFQEADRCEICTQRYTIPPGVVEALAAEGALPRAPLAARLGQLLLPAYRLLRPLASLLEVAVVAVGAASYALEAVRLTPAVLADPVSLLRPRGWELGRAAVTLVAFPIVYALRGGGNDPAVQLRRLRRGIWALKLFHYSFLLGGAALVDYVQMGRRLSDPSLPPFLCQRALRGQALDQALVSVAFPLAAALVGGCSAWWRLALWWLRPASEAAALQAAVVRLAGEAQRGLEAAGVLAWLREAGAWLGSHAALRQLWEWAAGGLGGGGGGKGRGRPFVGSLRELLQRIESMGGLDAAGVFSA